MAVVHVDVAADLRIDGNEMPQGLWDEILDDLTIENREKIIAKRMKRWKWQELPDNFLLAEWDGAQFRLPRGYAMQLKLLLAEKGHRVLWHDHRQGQRGQLIQWREKITWRDHQIDAVKAMRKHQQGIYEAPTGSGKTLACLKFIHDVSPQKTVILTDQIGLLQQWIKEISRWLGEEYVGQIGSGVWNDSRRISVATVQTIWSALEKEKITDDFFHSFDCMWLNECHHAPARTIREIVGKFNSKWRIGDSATPDRKDGKFEFALAILGEVFLQEDEDALRSRGILVKPTVQVVKTDFDFPYWPDHESNGDGCLKPGCRIQGQHAHRNNYHKLKTALVKSKCRNLIVVDTVERECRSGNHIHVISSNEIRQLDEIEELLRVQIPVYRLTGESRGKQRKTLVDKINNSSEAVVLATVAKEGLDIPSIDRIYLPFPIAGGAVVKQIGGRGTRLFDGKKDTIIFDFVDENIPVLKKQFAKRAHGFYHKSGIEIIK